jgi:hypothetical protein
MTKYNMSTVYVDFDSREMNITITDYSLIKLLSSRNQNLIEQINKINDQNIFGKY